MSMPKFLLLLFTTLSFATTSYGKAKTFISDGSLDELWNIPALMGIEFDYSQAVCDGMPLQSVIDNGGMADWKSLSEKAEKKFLKKLKEETRKLKISFTDTLDACAYKMKISVMQIDFGDAASGILLGGKNGGCSISATIVIYSISSDKNICTITVDRLKGLGKPNWGFGSTKTQRTDSAYSFLAKDLAKIFKEHSKSKH